MLFWETAGPALKINILGNVRKWEGNFTRSNVMVGNMITLKANSYVLYVPGNVLCMLWLMS